MSPPHRNGAIETAPHLSREPEKRILISTSHKSHLPLNRLEMKRCVYPKISEFTDEG